MVGFEEFELINQDTLLVMLEDEIKTIFGERNRMNVRFSYYGCCSVNKKRFYKGTFCFESSRKSPQNHLPGQIFWQF